MPAPSASSPFTVAREVLAADLDLPSDAVLARLRAKGVKGLDKDLRLAINSVRKKLRKKAAPAPKPVPVAARKTTGPVPSASAAVRAVMTADPGLAIDAVIQKVKAQGVTAPDATIRQAVHNVRSGLKKAAKAAPPSSTPAPSAVVVPAPAPPPAVADVFSNVALVNAAVTAAGGVEQARKVAEAVRACGGPEQFAQYLDLVAGIRTG
jgi:hypothetical protein